MSTLSFKLQFSVYVFLAFIVLVVIGTLTHELGHVAVAKCIGYDVELSYGSMVSYQKGYKKDADVIKLESLNDKYLHLDIEVIEKLDDSIKNQAKALTLKVNEKFPYNKTDNLLITLGGPMHTIVTSLLGLLILFYRKSKQRSKFQLLDWLGVFLGLFILREVFNTLMAFKEVLFFADAYFVGDEFSISRILNLNQWIIPILTLFLGLIISVYIIFKVIPKTYRIPFVVSGVIGGILGYGIWFGFLGQLFFQSPISF